LQRRAPTPPAIATQRKIRRSDVTPTGDGRIGASELMMTRRLIEVRSFLCEIISAIASDVKRAG